MTVSVEAASVSKHGKVVAQRKDQLEEGFIISGFFGGWGGGREATLSLGFSKHPSAQGGTEKCKTFNNGYLSEDSTLTTEFPVDSKERQKNKSTEPRLVQAHTGFWETRKQGLLHPERADSQHFSWT